MQPLNLQEIYCVSNHRELADDATLESLAQRCGKLPDGYAELVTTLGFGTLDDLRILKPDEIAQSTPFLRESLQMWAEFAEEFDSPMGFPESSLEFRTSERSKLPTLHFWTRSPPKPRPPPAPLSSPAFPESSRS